ncbi:MAG: hypothetical protein PHT78_06580, partial [Desulfitobacteriaceae bacterium]|nr:hypothetical protein [Desulfitobacteriaceae bacterium]
FRTGVRLPPPPPNNLPSIDKKYFISRWFYFCLKSLILGDFSGFGFFFLLINNVDHRVNDSLDLFLGMGHHGNRLTLGRGVHFFGKSFNI